MRRSDIIRCYIEWCNEGEVPCTADLARHFGEPIESLHAFLTSPRVVTVLQDRYNLPPPIKHKSTRSLTDEQRAWIIKCTNPYTKKSIQALCNEFGIPMETHRRWMKQAAFNKAYTEALKGEIRTTEGELYRRTASRAMDGDNKSLELLYRMQGKPLPTAISAEGHSGVPLEKVLQVMQEICTPEQLSVIATRLLTNDIQPGPTATASLEAGTES